LTNYRCKIESLINKDDIYHLWIVSFTQARQDLFVVANYCIEALSQDRESYYLYFLKMNIAHLKESIHLLNYAFKDCHISERMQANYAVKVMYSELEVMLYENNNKSFYFEVLIAARYSSFHYDKND